MTLFRGYIEWLKEQKRARARHEEERAIREAWELEESRRNNEIMPRKLELFTNKRRCFGRSWATKQVHRSLQPSLHLLGHRRGQ